MTGMTQGDDVRRGGGIIQIAEWTPAVGVDGIDH
jgi:hypothetical protein